MTAAGTKQKPRPYCDLVMKGGITSGLVYPMAVHRIGQHYWFRNIGGTSAGAIAAALSAAAALGERRLANGECQSGGLKRLKVTAEKLATPGFIFSLFQPVKKARGAFDLLVSFTEASKPRVIVLAAKAALLEPIPLVLTFAFFGMIGFVAGGVGGLIAAAIPAAAVAFGVAVVVAAMQTAETIRSNFFGLCTGLRQADAKPGLTEWMHAEIRQLAGLEEEGDPVTFGDLWNSPLYPGEKPLSADERPLNLEVITTDASHSEPRTLPFTKGTLWFRKDDVLRLFPQVVVEAMIARAKAPPLDHDNQTYHAFPAAADLPIVVAARMSLSFPLLISAVPLYEQHFLKKEDRSQEATRAEKAAPLAESVEDLASNASGKGAKPGKFEMRVCWFTDGGVSSNFPIHLFDAPMPRWPTFAIDLVYPPAGRKPSSNPIFLPERNDQGWRPRYTSFRDRWAAKEIGGFLAAIVSTMQNWRDLLQGRAPGHRDRIVQVEIESNEGGLNLNMPDDVLKALAGKGELAGAKLADAFDFENHFWVRYRNLQAALERFGIRLDAAMASPPAGAETAYNTAKDGRGAQPSYEYTAEQAKEAAHRLNALLQEFETWGDSTISLTKGAPNPPPHLRIVPIF